MRVTRKSTIVAFILLMTFFSAVDVAAKTAAAIFEKVSPGIVIMKVYNEKG